MKLFIKTYGCSFNQRDSENIKGVLKEANHSIVEDESEADAIVVNSCGVKSVTQNKIISYVNSRNKPVYVGGCLPKMTDLTKIENVKGVFDPNTILEFPKQIEEGKLKNFSIKKEHRINIPIVRSENDRLILPISQGCLGYCSYCSVKYVRGNLKSYRVGDLVREVRESVQKHGVKKVFFTSQDCSCFGFDIETNLAELLNQVVEIEGDFVIRVGMMSPEHLFRFLPEFLEAMKHKKVMRFVHLPIQSGSNKVLKEMRRKYTVEEYKELVSKIRSAIPDIHIATDIIVGYPTETEEDFQQTIELMKELKFEVVNLSKFGARPKTTAARLPQLPSQEIKRRSRIISELIRNHQ